MDLFSFDKNNPQRYYLCKIVEDYRRHTAFVVNRARGTRGVPVWQSRFRDDGLRTPAAVREAVRYVISNPVVAGLASMPEEYPWVTWDPEWLV